LRGLFVHLGTYISDNSVKIEELLCGVELSSLCPQIHHFKAIPLHCSGELGEESIKSHERADVKEKEVAVWCLLITAPKERDLREI